MNLTPARPQLNRRTWHVRANSVVLAWLLAAVVMSVVHRWVPGSGWVMTHMMLLGAVTSAILIWSGHFADTLLGRPAPGGQEFMVVRLAVHTVGAVSVILGVATDTWGLVVAGGAAVAAAALTHVAVIWRQRRGAVMARFGKLSLFYVAAGLFLVAGVVLGVLLARTTPDAALQGRLYTAHVGTMLMGFVGLTVLGTLVVLWPTMLRTKMVPGAPLAAYTALWVLVTGVAGVWVTALTGVRALAVVAALVYLTGMVLMVRPMVVVARSKPPRSFATLSAAAAVVWAAACVLALGAVVAGAEGWATVPDAVGVLAAPFAVGFAGQVLLGALSYLAPVMLGGGPSVVRAVNEEMDRAAAARVVVVNACLVLFVAPVPSLVRVTSSLLGLAAMAAFLVLLARAGWARARAARRRDADVLGATIRTGPPAPRRRLGATSGAAAVALAVVLGVAGDPAAAGLGTADAAAQVTATGRTTTVQVEARDMRFHPAAVEVPAGDRLVLEVTNTDDDVHDLVLATGAGTGRLSAGQSTTLDLGVVGADLEGWCSVAGHRQMGMTFDVVVTGGQGPNTAGGTDARGHGTSHGGTSHGGTSDGGADGRSHGAAGDDGATAAPDLMAEPGVPAHDPALPPAPEGEVHEHTFTVGETRAEVAPGVRQERWAFNGTAPGPTLRGKVGDTFVITLVNDGTIGHSIDFHAGALAPDEPMRTIGPGEELTYTFTAERSGIWMYHCSTTPMSMHIANGMFGAVVIDPPHLAPVDREYLLVQSEVYLGADGGPADADKIAAEAPDLVVFNGHGNQYDHAPLPARAGERVRVWVLDAGPSRASAFHVVGGQFDTVYSEGAYTLGGPDAASPTGGAQVLPLLPAQGGFVELALPEAGTYPFVSHAMVDAERGAHGLFAVTD